MASTQDPYIVPVVASLSRSFGVITFVAAACALGWVGLSLAWHGIGALDPTPYLPWTSDSFPRHAPELALPCALAAPLFAVAYINARRHRTVRCGRWFVWGVFAIALAKVLPRGVVSAGWFLQPLLIVLTAVAFGALPGVAMAVMAATALTACAMFDVDPMLAVSRRDYALPIVGILLGGGLLGSLLHQAMHGLLELETEQRERIERTLRALRRRERLLRHAMRVATIGEMAGMVVHQLRNKFQLVSGHVALGLQGDATEKDRRLEQIRTSIQAAATTVEQLLTLAHPGEGAERQVDLTVECRSFADRVRPILPGAIRLETEIGDTPACAVLSPEELEHALLNLVLNAKQAIRQGTIRLVAGVATDKEVAIAVIDDGPGIDPAVRERLFTPFVTTKPKGEGTGLGLVAVDRFVRKNGGHIEVRSEPGNGATFTLFFPRRKVAMPVAAS